MQAHGRLPQPAGLAGQRVGQAFGGKLPVVARAAGATKFKFIATLQRASLRVGLEELEGEVTLFATIQRKLRTGEKYTVLDSMAGIALSALPRAERRKMEASMKKDSKDFPDAVIGAPAAVVTPVAVYR
jgi:hypothetical protein